jgi:hypothetical protein
MDVAPLPAGLCVLCKQIVRVFVGNVEADGFEQFGHYGRAHALVICGMLAGVLHAGIPNTTVVHSLGLRLFADLNAQCEFAVVAHHLN